MKFLSAPTLLQWRVERLADSSHCRRSQWALVGMGLPQVFLVMGLPHVFLVMGLPQVLLVMGLPQVFLVLVPTACGAATKWTSRRTENALFKHILLFWRNLLTYVGIMIINNSGHFSFQQQISSVCRVCYLEVRRIGAMPEDVTKKHLLCAFED